MTKPKPPKALDLIADVMLHCQGCEGVMYIVPHYLHINVVALIIFAIVIGLVGRSS